MIKIRNTKDELITITGYKGFTPNEIREVSTEDAKTLLRNPFLVEVSSLEAKNKTKEGTKRKSEK